MKLSGTLLRYDEKNLNGRIYTKETVEEIVEQFNEQKNSGIPMFGELGYTETFETSLKNVSHSIDEIHIDENTKSLIGNITLLDNPRGKILKELLDNDLVVFRPRGSGNGDILTGEIKNYTIYSFDVIQKNEDSFNITDL